MDLGPPPDLQLHAMAFKDLFTGPTQLCAVLLQARLNGHIIIQLFSTKAGSIARTSLVIALVQRELISQQVSLRTELAPSPPMILGDRVQLQQVMINLVMNGIEAMQSVTDRPRELVIRSHQDETRRVLVSVTDCGSGSPPRTPTGCSTPSSPLNPAVWVWDSRSAVRSSKLTGDGCGARQTYPTAPRFSSPCR
jgi:hypothetical protein